MKSFTLWLGQSAGDVDSDRARPLELTAATLPSAILEAHQRWASRADLAGPAHLWIFENAGGRMVYEMATGPSC